MTDDTTNQGIPAPEGAADLIETGYEIGQDNFEGSVGPIGFDIHNPVFMISGITIVAFVFYTLALPEQSGALFTWLFSAVTTGFDWFFIGAANIFVLFCLFLIVTPYGSVRLGGAEATPDYTYIGWFAMLFAAGMGIGLMFYGVSEPMSHFSTSLGGTASEGGVRTDWAPLGAAAGNEAEAVRLGMAATIFHWGLHPWAIYAVVALALALFTYNKGLPLTIRSAFYPIFGERVWGWTGHVIRLCNALRPCNLAGFRRDPGQCGSQPPLRHPGRQHHRGSADLRHHRDRADLGHAGAGWRREGAVRDQHGPRLPALDIRPSGRADNRDPVGLRVQPDCLF